MTGCNPELMRSNKPANKAIEATVDSLSLKNSGKSTSAAEQRNGDRILLCASLHGRSSLIAQPRHIKFAEMPYES